jgi:hypothetical protein
MSPPLPPRYLAQKLSEALPTTDGGVLRTIADAVNYMLELSKKRGIANSWQHYFDSVRTLAA